jgi:hypothetical protein
MESVSLPTELSVHVLVSARAHFITDSCTQIFILFMLLVFVASVGVDIVADSSKEAVLYFTASLRRILSLWTGDKRLTFVSFGLSTSIIFPPESLSLLHHLNRSADEHTTQKIEHTTPTNQPWWEGAVPEVAAGARRS